MKIVIIGGRLQGVEAAYLARKAGWQTVVVDIDKNAPAAGICDFFLNIDALNYPELARAIAGADFILPATENKEVLASLQKSAENMGIPLIYDERAYRISSSKQKSNKLFAAIGVPTPKPYPACGFPVIVKPSGSSGSEGVRLAETPAALEQIIRDGQSGQPVIEEYLEGPSYSLEVISWQDRHVLLQITELGMDDQYDCKQVIAPAGLTSDLEEQFESIALNIARSLHMDGIFDIEVILHNGLLKVLEIDARLPSQTPTTVYMSSGINMLEILSSFCSGKNDFGGCQKVKARGCVYEHIKVTKPGVEICGEHIMAQAGRLTLRENFYGADEALTNYVPGKEEWVATLIATGDTRGQALKKMKAAVSRIGNSVRISDLSLGICQDKVIKPS
jgi:pyrrolysine biosynthesis protein PylC